ncbi:MAG TPA: flagellar filament capping protein FliD [Anaeromyxobacteraceae bacterium]|nr:flagellar filament capping protein FliD [Anaeromyxobacteraceae bacterium]
MSTSISPSFTAGGLASGLDTNSIIDGLVKLEQQPITLLQDQQTGMKAQVSTLGILASRLSALETAAKALRDGGVLGVKATSTNAALAVAPGAGAVAGSYTVQVTSLATTAKMRSVGLADGSTLRAGSLTLKVDGVDYSSAEDGSAAITWRDGASLDEVAARIRASGAPVTATVLFDGRMRYLSVTKRDSGYVADGSQPSDGADKALAVSDDLGQLGMAWLKDGDGNALYPTNAEFTIDGLAFTRRSNTVSDALPGTTLALKSSGGPAENVTLEDDVEATKAKLQTYVTAYNAVAQVVQGQLSPAPGTDRVGTLAGSGVLRGLQQSLQSIGGLTVPGLGTVRSLADVGLETNRDGTLSIDDETLSAAIARDATAVNDLFSKASGGIAAAVSKVVDTYVDPVDGLLVQAQTSLNGTIKRMDDQVDQMNSRVDAYRASLTAQFAAMERIVSQYKSIGSFLTMQSQQQQNGK